jgi:uncharacterized membrane protein YedE/YeeE
MAMTLPLYMKDFFGFPSALVLGTLLGFAFGFVLERAGFGRASVLAAQFYFRDNRVLKVMFSAIVTAMLGTVVLSAVGVLDMAAVVIPPTFIWPQLVGGLLVGIGFIVSGYCPGTSVVAMASGRLDGLMIVVGVSLGSLGFGLVFTRVESFYTSSSMGPLRFSDLLGVPAGVLALGVAIMAIGAFLGVEKLERAMAARDGVAPPPGSGLVRRRALAGFALGGILAVALIWAPPPGQALADKPIGKSIEKISAVELAQRIVERPASMFLVDLREPCPEDVIPGAMCVPVDTPEFLADLPTTRTLVLYAAGDLETIPDAAHRFPGTVWVLEGGYAAFNAVILTPPELPEDPSRADIEQFQFVSALNAFFTGVEARSPQIQIQPRKMVRTTKKKGAGC